MWGLSKEKTNLSIVLYVSIHVLAATLVFGCNSRTFYEMNRDKLNKVNQIPEQTENPDDPILDSSEILNDPTVPHDPNRWPDLTAPNDIVIDIPEPEISDTPKSPDKPDEPVKKVNANSSRAAKVIAAANWVVTHEARKLGTPCNFYVSRVLVLTGYSKDRFRANDFDIYARKNFASANVERFTAANLESERLRLKRHIWSFPSRTPFILQWERSGKPGHIAIVERVGDKLVIYQSSLNRFIPRKEQTSISDLLGRGRSKLTIYADFTPR